MKLTAILKEIQVGSRPDIVNSTLNNNLEDVEEILEEYIFDGEDWENLNFKVKEIKGMRFSVAYQDDYDAGFVFSDNKKEIDELSPGEAIEVNIGGKKMWFITY